MAVRLILMIFVGWLSMTAFLAQIDGLDLTAPALARGIVLPLALFAAALAIWRGRKE